MTFMVRPSCGFPVRYAVMYKAKQSIVLLLACCFGFWSMFTLMVLGREPAYAEWVAVGGNDDPGMTLYVDPATIRRKGNFVKVWELLDYKTVHTKKGISHLSVTVQFEYDCVKEQHRLIALREYSDNMGSGRVVLSNLHEVPWAPLESDTLGHSLWTYACNMES